MSSLIQPVILSGGAGTRLWPLSREQFPKQMQRLHGGNTMIQDSALRVGDAARYAAPMVICNQEQRFGILTQLGQAGVLAKALVIEPVGRNTAPAVAVAALMAEDPDTLLLVMPSDHVIADQAAFQAAVTRAAAQARAGRLVTFGIVPTAPETGYGYIKRGAALAEGVHAVERFVEKPDRETAEAYLASGDYAWNSGLFLFSAGALLAELERLCPDMLELCRRALAEGAQDLSFFRLAEAPFAAIKGQSIDYAVMEHTRLAAVVPVAMGWSDIGSWTALWEISAKDDQGNVTLGHVEAKDTHDCYLRADHGMVAALGLEGLMVVATEDAVLVASRDHAQEVRHVVERLKAAGRPEAVEHPTSFRPWGSFHTIDQGDRFKVKQIVVNPGQRLSLQKHLHRSEHWIVVQGVARVTSGEREFLLHENESTFIPAGTMHRLENPGKVPLCLIEVQTGGYLGEDDIVRVEDSYGRVG